MNALSCAIEAAAIEAINERIAKFSDEMLAQELLKISPMTPTEAARFLGMRRETLERESGIPFALVYGKRRYLPETLLEWLKQKQDEACNPS